MNNLAENYFAMGQCAEALKRGKETLALRQAKLGPDHRETLWSMQVVADSYSAGDRELQRIRAEAAAHDR